MTAINTRIFILLALAISLMAVPVAAQQTGQTKVEKEAEDKLEKVATAETTEKKAAATNDAMSKTVSAKFVHDAESFTPKTSIAEPVLRPKPTPTPADQTAQPAQPVSNGSNPADLITRVEMKYQFQNFGSGYLHGVPVIRGDYAFTKTISVRMDLPILTFDPKAPGGSSESGIGDIVTSMTFVKMFSKKFVGAFVPRIDFPTASHASRGSGKYTFNPLIAGITPLAPGLGFVGILEYHVSFAGNRNRTDINELRIKPIILKSFLKGPLKGYYVNPKLELIIDFETNNRTTTQAGAEFGKALNKNVVVFAIPTFHVAGTKKESFKLEIGFRYLFR